MLILEYKKEIEKYSQSNLVNSKLFYFYVLKIRIIESYT